VFATATTRAYDMLSKVQSGNVKAAIDAVKALDHRATGDVLAKINVQRPTTLGGQLQMVAAFQAALRGSVYEQMAATAIAGTTDYLESASSLSPAQLGSPETADKVMSALAQTLLYVTRATAETTLATDELELGDAPAVPYTASLPPVQRATAWFASAAAAGIAYVDLLLEIKDDEARKRVALYEPDYLVGYVTLKIGTGAFEPRETAPSLPQGLVKLAASELAYYDAAALIAKYHSLGVHTGDDGNIDAVAHDKALIHLLATAERNARASAHAAKIATGAIPVQAKLAYQLATVEREGDLDDKLDALAELWTSSAFSQAAVMFARN
jgi:hypothetical protein